MANLISINTPNLLNGVSQQAEELRRPTQATEQINALSSLVEGLKKRPPTLNQKTLTDAIPSTGEENYFGFIVDRDSSEQHYIRTSTNLSTAAMRIDNLLSLSASVTIKNGAGSVASPSDFNYLRTDNAQRDLRHLTVDDYTFIINKAITPAMSSTQSDAAVPCALAFVKEVRDDATYTIELWADPADTSAADYVAQVTATSTWDQGDVTSALVTALNTAGASTEYQYTYEGSLLFIKQTNETDFRMEVTSTLGDGMTLIKDEVDDLASLPAEGYAGFIIKVIGTADSADEDAYWVEYISQNSQITSGFTSGYWQECVGPSEYTTIDATTMPHVLISNADGTFTFKAADWAVKTAGDSDSAPDPSFIGEPIRGALYHQNRLGFLSGESLIFSEVGEHFNFFRTTVVQLIDSDPIDIQLSNPGISLLNYAISSSEKLLIFSNNTQFSVSSGGERFSPATVESSVSSQSSNYTNCGPVQIGNSIFFGFQTGQYSGIKEYFAGNTTNKMDGDTITDHIPSYITGEVDKIVAINEENMLIVMTDGYTNGLYAYKFYNNGPERVQAAWFKFSFGDDAEVRDINAIGTKLYVTLGRGDDYYLEVMDLASGLTDADSTMVVCLDRRITESDLVSISYSAVTDLTTLTLPYSATENGTMAIVERTVDGNNLLNGVSRVAGDDTQLTVAGDYTAAELYIGEEYEMLYQITRPTIRDQQGQSSLPIYTGRAQVRYAHVALDNSVLLTAEVTPIYRDTYSYTYQSRSLGTGGALLGAMDSADAIFKIPIMSKNSQFDLTFKNASPWPSTILGVTWEVLYHTRSR